MTGKTQERILTACYKFLLPIARTLLLHGIGFREFDSVCRRAFVDAATQEFGVRGRRTNTSRVAAMTGLPRKEVHRIKSLKSSVEEGTTELLSPMADLLHVWATAKEYQDDLGHPATLSTDTSDAVAFSRLVKSCMGDVPPGAVKTELIRMGAVEQTANNGLRLIRRTLIPEDSGRRLESSIIYSLVGLAETIANNNDPRIEESGRRFERYVESRLMTGSEIHALEPNLLRMLTEFTEALDDRMSEGEAAPIEGTEPRRIGVGVYFVR